MTETAKESAPSVPNPNPSVELPADPSELHAQVKELHNKPVRMFQFIDDEGFVNVLINYYNYCIYQFHNLFCNKVFTRKTPYLASWN